MGSRHWAAALLALLAISWGAIPLIVRGDVPWQQLVAARVWLGALTVIGFLAIRGRLTVPSTDRGRVAISGSLLAAHWASFFLAITETTVAIALAILYLGPVLASVLAPRLLGESAHRRVYSGLGIALAGVLLVVRPGGEITALGLAAAVFSAVSLATLMLVAKPAVQRLGALTMAASELSVASIVMTPWAIQAVVESSEFWMELVILGVLLTGVAAVIYWQAMRQLPIAGVAVLMYLEPASAIVWALVFLGERPDLLAWVGIGLVLTGGILSSTATADEVVHVPAAI